MDPDQFDALVARLVAAQSRRDALSGAVGGALASIGITSIAESRRGKHRDAAERKKKNHPSGADQREDHDAHGQRKRHKNHRGNRNSGQSAQKSNNNADAEKKKKKKNRCKKNGEPCARNGKCCSNHCNPNTGTCTRKPVS